MARWTKCECGKLPARKIRFVRACLRIVHRAGGTGWWACGTSTTRPTRDVTVSPGGHDGQFRGNAKVVAAQLPIRRPPIPVAPNRVLELDGSNSFVELPDDAFTNLTTATIEGWVRWDAFGSSSRFFDFTVGSQTFDVQNRERSSDLWLERDRVDGSDFVQLPDVLSIGRWTHVAAVVGPETLKLYLDGVPVSTNLVRSGSFHGGGGETQLPGPVQLAGGTEQQRCRTSAERWTRCGSGKVNAPRHKSARTCRASLPARNQGS